jgi:hypothetical protein
MVKEFPYVGFADIARESDPSARVEPLPLRLRLPAASLIERNTTEPASPVYSIREGWAWVLYRVANLLDRWS